MFNAMNIRGTPLAFFGASSMVVRPVTASPKNSLRDAEERYSNFVGNIDAGAKLAGSTKTASRNPWLVSRPADGEAVKAKMHGTHAEVDHQPVQLGMWVDSKRGALMVSAIHRSRRETRA